MSRLRYAKYHILFNHLRISLTADIWPAGGEIDIFGKSSGIRSIDYN